MSERGTVCPFVLRGDNRDFPIVMTIKTTVNSTKAFANSKKVFFRKKTANHNIILIYFADTGILC